MRALSWLWIGLPFLFVGCCGSHDGGSTCTPTPKSAGEECTEGDCCRAPSRSEIVARSEETESAVALKTVKFDAFMKDVKAHKGKVVAAYLWSNAAGPSKKNLAMMPELQRKFAKDGLVCMTVSNDKKEASKAALQCLEKAGCDFVNYLQDEDEPVEGWASCFGCCGFPVLVVFGRDGKQAASFEVTEMPFEAAVIEKALVKALNAK